MRPPVVAWWGQVLVLTDILDKEFGEDTKGPAQSGILDLSFYSVPQFLQLRKGIHDSHEGSLPIYPLYPPSSAQCIEETS